MLQIFGMFTFHSPPAFWKRKEANRQVFTDLTLFIPGLGHSQVYPQYNMKIHFPEIFSTLKNERKNVDHRATFKVLMKRNLSLSYLKEHLK